MPRFHPGKQFRPKRIGANRQFTPADGTALLAHHLYRLFDSGKIFQHRPENLMALLNIKPRPFKPEGIKRAMNGDGEARAQLAPLLFFLKTPEPTLLRREG